MKNYEAEIINRLLDIYERRGAYKKDPDEIRAITLSVEDVFPEYTNAYNHTAYQEINAAIGALKQKELISGEPTERGAYKKIRFRTDHTAQSYTFAKRQPLREKYGDLEAVLENFRDSGTEILDHLTSDFEARIREGKKLPYGIAYDAGRLKEVLRTLKSILTLQEETYIRNFSNALFKDSKVFQKEYKSVIQSILYDYTEASVEKDRILEVYNLYENPTYVLLKGNALIISGSSRIHLHEFTGGIAVPEKALEDIVSITVLSSRVVTVENLTTFHDCMDSRDLYIYLGGFHNRSKEKLLEMIYEQNPDKAYYHKGDLDVYGFAILESLKARTGIPFRPLEMDVETLKRFYDAGLYRTLSETDRKAMKAPALKEYEEIFRFMLEHNCKAEQESVKAIGLLE